MSSEANPTDLSINDPFHPPSQEVAASALPTILDCGEGDHDMSYNINETLLADTDASLLPLRAAAAVDLDQPESTLQDEDTNDDAPGPISASLVALAAVSYPPSVVATRWPAHNDNDRDDDAQIASVIPSLIVPSPQPQHSASPNTPLSFLLPPLDESTTICIDNAYAAVSPSRNGRVSPPIPLPPTPSLPPQPLSESQSLPSHWRCRCMAMTVIVGLLLLLAVLVPVLVVSSSFTSSLPMTPSPVALPSRLETASRAQQVTAFINNITLTGLTLVPTRDATTPLPLPEELALRWLIDYDTDWNFLPNAPPNRFRLLQRYALAILQVQRDAANPFSGNTGEECEWNGVICRSMDLGSEIGVQQAVAAIYVDTYNNGNRWTGRLSADVTLLSNLIHFNMSSGSMVFGMRGGLMKRLPSQIGRWTDLESIDLSANALTGALPSQIGQLTKLRYFLVDSNLLTGTLPFQIGQLTRLQTFDASHNALTGHLPVQIGQMTNLQTLSVPYNGLVGSVPTQIGQLTNLQGLDVSVNALNGTLPSQIGQLTNLEYLFVYENNFTAPMPNSVCQLRHQSLTFLWADCADVSCNKTCCTSCGKIAS
jgi:hypothetical protein